LSKNVANHLLGVLGKKPKRAVSEWQPVVSFWPKKNLNFPKSAQHHDKTKFFSG